MTDVFSKEKRSEVMSKIRGKDTKFETLVRKELFAKGFRYRKNDKRLPGKPDIVLPKYQTVIFIHGCYWHRHEDCKYAYTPKSRIEFWESKIKGNVDRDRQSEIKLKEAGWKVIVVWECELKKNVNECMDKLVSEIIK